MYADGFEKHVSGHRETPATPEAVVKRAQVYAEFLRGSADPAT